MYNGVIVSDGPPAHVTGYAWVKVLEDGSREWYHFDIATQTWMLDHVEDTHPNHHNLAITGTVSIDGIKTLTKTVNNPTKIRVHKGLIVGME